MAGTAIGGKGGLEPMGLFAMVQRIDPAAAQDVANRRDLVLGMARPAGTDWEGGLIYRPDFCNCLRHHAAFGVALAIGGAPVARCGITAGIASCGTARIAAGSNWANSGSAAVGSARLPSTMDMTSSRTCGASPMAAARS